MSKQCPLCSWPINPHTGDCANWCAHAEDQRKDDMTETETPETLPALCEKHHIRLIATKVENDDPAWRDATKWTVVLCRGGVPSNTDYQTTYYQGSAHKDPPTAADVLYCLLSDASSVEGVDSFEAWCEDVGLDSDSRKAEKTYNTCKATVEPLRRLLGGDYDALVRAAQEY